MKYAFTKYEFFPGLLPLPHVVLLPPACSLTNSLAIEALTLLKYKQDTLLLCLNTYTGGVSASAEVNDTKLGILA